MKTEKLHPIVRKVICTCYNCPRNLTCLIFGNEHKPHHKILTGIAIIIIGSVIGELPVSGLYLHLMQGSGCRFVEAMGSVPIIEHLGKIANTLSSHGSEQNSEVHEAVPNEHAVEHIDQ